MTRRPARPHRTGRAGSFVMLLIIVGLLVLILPFVLTRTPKTPAGPTPGDDVVVDPVVALPVIPIDTMEPKVRGQFNEAMAEMESDPDSADAAGQVGMLCQAYDFSKLAAPYYARAVDLDPYSLRWRYLLGVVELDNGRPKVAAQHLSFVLEREPENLPLLIASADAARLDGRDDDAIDLLNRALAVQPNLPHAHARLGQVYRDRDELAVAEEHLRAAVEAAPAFGLAQYTLGQVLRKQGRSDEARVHLELAGLSMTMTPPLDDPRSAAVDRLRTGAVDLLHRAIDLMQAGDVDVALPLLLESVQIDATLAETHSQLATAYLLRGELDAATAEIDLALDLDPNFVDALYHQGLIAFRRQQMPVAIDSFERVVAVRPDHFDAHLGLGTARHATGNYGGAVRAFNDAALLRPADNRPVKRAVRSLMADGRDADARTVLLDGLRRIPGDGSMRDRLAWLYATSPDPAVADAAEAVRLAEAVCVETRWGVPITMDTLAAALALAGRYDDAIEVATRGIGVARQQGNERLVSEMSTRLALYRAGQPYRRSR